MNETAIGWTDQTWNPVHGCSRVSEGCRSCYAERISRRFEHTEKPWTIEHAAENVQLKPDKLDEPFGITEPARVFVNSMSDLFHEQVPDSFIDEVFAVMRSLPQHVFQVLTKHPERASAYSQHAPDWPDNVWVGTSVENARVTDRLDALRLCEAATLFVSFEPLIGPVGDVDLSGYEWAIVGGESGPDHRKMDHRWARAIRDQCERDDVAFFFKQSAGQQPEQGQALVEENLTRTVHRELPDLPAVTKAARNEQPVATVGTREVAP